MKLVSLALLLVAPLVLANVSVYLNVRSTDIGKPVEGYITVFNARSTPIPEKMMCKITTQPFIKPDGSKWFYFAEQSIAFDKEIPAHGQLRVSVTIPVVNARLPYLTEVVRTECTSGNEKFSSELHLGTELFKATWNHAKILDILKRLNIIFFGIGAAGKSYTINTINSALSDEIQYLPAAAFKGTTHCTEELKGYPLTDKHKFFDTVGFSNHERLRTEKFLKYIMLGLVPENVNLVTMTDNEWVNFMQKLDGSYAEYLKLPFEEQLAKRMHVPVFFVTYAAISNDKVLDQVASVFRTISRLGHNPLVVLTFVQTEKPEAVISAKKDLANALGIQTGQILASMVYRDETEKSFTIDKSNLMLLDKIHDMANAYTEGQVAQHKEEQQEKARIDAKKRVAEEADQKIIEEQRRQEQLKREKQLRKQEEMKRALEETIRKTEEERAVREKRMYIIGTVVFALLIVAGTAYYLKKPVKVVLKEQHKEQPEKVCAEETDADSLPVKGGRTSVQELLRMSQQIPVVNRYN